MPGLWLAVAIAELGALRQRNAELHELAEKRHALLRVACSALEVEPEPGGDAEMVQALRAVGVAHQRALERQRRAIDERDDALAALAAMILEEHVAPKQHPPGDLVRIAGAHRRRQLARNKA